MNKVTNQMTVKETPTLATETSLLQWYLQSCQELKCKPNSSLAFDVLQPIAQCRDLLCLDISSNFVGPRGALPVVHVASHAPALTHLDLSGNRLTNESVEALCGILVGHLQLRTLGLSNNPISQTGAKHLVSLAWCTPQLQHIALDGTMVSEALKSKIAEALSQRQEHAAYAAKKKSDGGLQTEEVVAADEAAAIVAPCEASSTKAEAAPTSTISCAAPVTNTAPVANTPSCAAPVTNAAPVANTPPVRTPRPPPSQPSKGRVVPQWRAPAIKKFKVKASELKLQKGEGIKLLAACCGLGHLVAEGSNDIDNAVAPNTATEEDEALTCLKDLLHVAVGAPLPHVAVKHHARRKRHASSNGHQPKTGKKLRPVPRPENYEDNDDYFALQEAMKMQAEYERACAEQQAVFESDQLIPE